MNAYKDAHLLVVDNDRDACAHMQQIISSWGMMVEAFTNPHPVLDKVKKNYYNVLFLDVYMPEDFCLCLIPEIKKYSSDSKVIITIGNGDKEIVVQALQLGAFDFLEKPIDEGLLSYAVKRALESQEIEDDYRRVCEDLECTQQDLLAYQQRLGDVDGKLVETKQVLSMLAQTAEKEREEAERRIVLQARSMIIPLLEKLKQKQDLKRYAGELNMIVQCLEDMTSGLATDIKIVTALSFSELRVASLIKNGMSTEQIAKHLYISASTVKTHRRNIRRKLGINKSCYNLRNYLESMMQKESGVSLDHYRNLKGREARGIGKRRSYRGLAKRMSGQMQ